MSSQTFQFSAAARLYSQNVAVVDEIKKSKAADARKLYKENKALINEMKAAAYQEVATFGDLVLKELARLPWEQEGARLCQQTAFTVKRWKGQRINYRWLRPATEQENEKGRTDGGHIALMVPKLDIIMGLDDDTYLHKYFDVHTKTQVTVALVCYVSPESRRHLVTSLKENSAVGTFSNEDTTNEWNDIIMPIDLDNPVSPVVESIAALLRDIYKNEYPRS
jgi:hypothetical protein